MSYIKRTPEQQAASTAKSIATRQANIAKRDAERRDAYERRYLLKGEIEKMEARLNYLREVERFDDVANLVCGKTLLRESDIVNGAKQWQKYCGIYFLIADEKVVYVGQSVNVFSRIGQHVDKRFDRFTVIPCQKDRLDVLESIYIHMLSPKYNGNEKYNCAPMTLDALFMKVGGHPV